MGDGFLKKILHVDGFSRKMSDQLHFQERDINMIVVHQERGGNEILIPEKEDGKEREVDGEMKEEV